MKFVFRILFLPLVALCWIIKWLAVLTMKCSCYILSPALWFLGVCCVITIIKQQWNQTILLLSIVFAGIIFLVAATTIVVLTENIGFAIARICAYYS